MPAISPMSSSTRCWRCAHRICARRTAAFRVIDTHAGTGRYRSRQRRSRAAAANGATASAGSGARSRPTPPALLAPYLDACAAFNPDGALTCYPGSPLLIGHVSAAAGPADRLRARDRRRACLARNLRGDARVKAIAIDGWTALAAYIPPKERRGLVLIDPPYEERDELPRLAEASRRRIASGRPACLGSGTRSRTRARSQPSSRALVGDAGSGKHRCG